MCVALLNATHQLSPETIDNLRAVEIKVDEQKEPITDEETSLYGKIASKQYQENLKKLAEERKNYYRLREQQDTMLVQHS